MCAILLLANMDAPQCWPVTTSLKMLQGCRIGHLDRPAIGAWPCAVTSTPAAAMGLGQQGVGTLAVGGPADFVLFRGRRYSELLARPQFDRVRLQFRAACCRQSFP